MDRNSFHAGTIGFLYGVMGAGIIGCLALHRGEAAVILGIAIVVFSLGLVIGYGRGRRWRR